MSFPQRTKRSHLHPYHHPRQQSYTTSRELSGLSIHDSHNSINATAVTTPVMKSLRRSSASAADASVTARTTSVEGGGDHARVADLAPFAVMHEHERQESHHDKLRSELSGNKALRISSIDSSGSLASRAASVTSDTSTVKSVRLFF